MAGTNKTNLKINRETNEANMRINQMNNEFNAAEAEKNREFQQEMWDYTFQKENEYNTPSAQAARFKEAGLNPALMMSGNNTSSASSAPSGSTASAASPIPMQAYKIPTASITDALASAFGNMKVALESAGIGQQTGLVSQFGADRQRAEIQQILASTAQSEGNTNWLNRNPLYKNFLLSRPAAQMGMASFTQEKQAQGLNNMFTIANTGLMTLKADAQKVLNKYLEPGQIVGLFQQLSAIEETGTRIGLNRKAIEKRELDILQGYLNYETAKKVMPAVAESMRMSALYNLEQTKGAFPFARKSGYQSGHLEYKGLLKALRDLEFSDTAYSRWIDKWLQPGANLIGTILGGARSAGAAYRGFKGSEGRYEGYYEYRNLGRY